MILSISYDLNKPGKNYDELYEIIKSALSWAHPMESLWFIKSGESVVTWSDKLRAVMDQNDSLFVVDITGQPRQGWISTEVWNWLSNN
jgi:hypothetical protein